MPIPGFIRSLREKVGTEMLLVPTVAAVIGDQAGRILVVRHIESGRWSFPGGIMEPLETPTNAIVREVWEETGLDVRPTRLVGVYGGDDFQVEYPNGDRLCFVMNAFACEVRSGTPDPDAEEIDRAEYLPAAEILRLSIPPFFPHVLKDLERGADAAAFQAPSWSPNGQAR